MAAQLLAFVSLTLGAFIVLLIGALSGHCWRGDKESRIDSRFWASMLIVFFTVCLPIVAVTATALRESKDLYVVVMSILPCFSAGLALKEHARNAAIRAALEARDPPRDGRDSETEPESRGGA